MIRFALQLTVFLAGFFAFCYVLGFLMPIFTHPVVFMAVVGFFILFALRLAFRGEND
jgi:hypothetical protein